MQIEDSEELAAYHMARHHELLLGKLVHDTTILDIDALNTLERTSFKSDDAHRKVTALNNPITLGELAGVIETKCKL